MRQQQAVFDAQRLQMEQERQQMQQAQLQFQQQLQQMQHFQQQQAALPPQQFFHSVNTTSNMADNLSRDASQVPMSPDSPIREDLFRDP